MPFCIKTLMRSGEAILMSNNNQRSAIVIVVFAILFASVPAALAHRPVWDIDGAEVIEIENLSTSFAFYRDLAVSTQVDVYTFEAEAGADFHAAINIPAIRGLEDYEVTMALVGPGLPEVDHDVLPTEHPEGLGALIFPSEVSEDFFEPFTQTNYWGRQSVDMALPESGAYYLLVWNEEGEMGKYVLATGRAEVFAPGDILRFPVWWVRVHAFFGHTPYIVGGAALALGGVAAIVIIRLRKKKQKDI